MTRVLSDIVDVYVFRRLNARVQFLLLQRRSDVPMARTWQAFHREIPEGGTAPSAAESSIDSLAGLKVDQFYSADFINQFYDDSRDAVVLAPVLAVTVTDQSSVTLADEFQDAGWFDRDEATARLPFSGQRWAVRHIDEIMGIGATESEMYRFDPRSTTDTGVEGDHPPTKATADAKTDDSELDQNDGEGLDPQPEPAGHPDIEASVFTAQEDEQFDDPDDDPRAPDERDMTPKSRQD